MRMTSTPNTNINININTNININININTNINKRDQGMRIHNGRVIFEVILQIKPSLNYDDFLKRS